MLFLSSLYVVFFKFTSACARVIPIPTGHSCVETWPSNLSTLFLSTYLVGLERLLFACCLNFLWKGTVQLLLLEKYLL